MSRCSRECFYENDVLLQSSGALWHRKAGSFRSLVQIGIVVLPNLFTRHKSRSTAMKRTIIVAASMTKVRTSVFSAKLTILVAAVALMAASRPSEAAVYDV